MPPLVSIVVPCYKGERYLAEALDSCLSQTYRMIEVIVVDDASPDHCAEIAAKYAEADSRVRVVRRAMNGGVSRAFNAGFGVAAGQYFARLAQDDVFEPNAVGALVDYLETHPSIGLAYGSFLRVDSVGETLSSVQPPHPGKVLSDGNKVGLCVLWRRDVAKKVGEFNPEYDSAEDYEYWFRVAALSQLGLCPGPPLMRVRVHDEMGSRVFSVQQEIIAAELCARHTQDRRQAAKLLTDGYYNAAYNSFEQRHLLDALRYAVRATRHCPSDLRLYKLLARVVLSAVRPSRTRNSTLRSP